MPVLLTIDVFLNQVLKFAFDMPPRFPSGNLSRAVLHSDSLFYNILFMQDLIIEKVIKLVDKMWIKNLSPTPLQ